MSMCSAVGWLSVSTPKSDAAVIASSKRSALVRVQVDDRARVVGDVARVGHARAAAREVVAVRRHHRRRVRRAVEDVGVGAGRAVRWVTSTMFARRVARRVHDDEHELRGALRELLRVGDLLVGTGRVDAVAVRVPVEGHAPAGARRAGIPDRLARVGVEVERLRGAGVVDHAVRVDGVVPGGHDAAVVGLQRHRPGRIHVEHPDLVAHVVPDVRVGDRGRDESSSCPPARTAPRRAPRRAAGR